MAKKTRYSVPDHLKGKDVWVKAYAGRKGDQPDRFILDECSQRDLKYLKSKGIDIES